MLQAWLLPLLLLLRPLICRSERPRLEEEEEDDVVAASHKLNLSDALTKACGKCDHTVHLDSTVGFEWVLFPPSPFPNPILTFMCTPEAEIQWDLDLELPLCPPEAIEGDVMKEKCETIQDRKRGGVAAYFSRKLKWMGSVPTTFCKIGEMIKAQWQRFVKIARAMMKKLRKLWHRAAGYSHYTPEQMVQQDMTIQRMIGNGLSHSLLQADGLRWNSSDAEIEDSLRQSLERHSSDPAEQFKHLSMMQVSMDQFEGSGDLHRLLLELQVNQTESLWKQKMEQLQPALETRQCQQAFASMQNHRTFDFSINIEFPDLAEAAISAITGSPGGVLKALLPEVLLMAIPKLNLESQKNKVDECLRLVESDFHDETCFDERPFLACTTRTLQKVLTGAMQGKWWPIGDKLDAQFSKSMRSIKSATDGTCLAGRGEDNSRDKPDQAYLEEKLENPHGPSDSLFNNRHCPMVKRLVGMALRDENDMPSNSSYAIWVASILNAGGECPDFTPFVASFCADQLKCVRKTKTSESPFNPYGSPNPSPDAVNSVKRLHLQSPDEQWDLLWRIVDWVQENQTAGHIGWHDIAGVINDGNARINLTLAARFWSAVHEYMIYKGGHRPSSENDYTKWPLTRKFFNMQTKFARMDDTWNTLVHRYDGDRSTGETICDTLRVTQPAQLQSKADGEIKYSVNEFKLKCCCWRGKTCSRTELEGENKAGKGQVFNVRLVPSDHEVCCRLQKGTCGGYFGGRFSLEAEDKSACMRAAEADPVFSKQYQPKCCCSKTKKICTEAELAKEREAGKGQVLNVHFESDGASMCCRLQDFDCSKGGILGFRNKFSIARKDADACIKAASR
eukprot:TRINITY_DN26776_c0_g1_i1.p1 TRINITY_DN26776_c0_g1~~TRINITY_DN26776_c0_g1_i1.p1  ORF type:complete len:846 (+),score=149.04 TRINITY_DN26776_c0_g1_i1:64-2601(+)